MLTGGRVLHHLKQVAPRPENTIFLPGFQSPGTRGARLADGEKKIRVHGEWYPVNCRVEVNRAISGHADRSQLLDWLASGPDRPEKVYLVHGEREAAESLAAVIRERGLAETVEVPSG